jgi:hypothetical protein
MSHRIALLPLIEFLLQQEAQNRYWRRELCYLSSVSLLEKVGRGDLVGDATPLVLKNYFSDRHAVRIVPGESAALREIVALLKETEVESVEADAVTENMQYGAEIANGSAQPVAGFYVGPNLKHGFLFGIGDGHDYTPVRWQGALPKWLASYWRQHREQYAP